MPEKSRSPFPEKTCAACGRTFAWRRKWAKDWENVRYCSAACRRSGRSAQGDAFERAILDLLGNRARGKTICSSEAARIVEPDGWKEHMEHARRAGRRLAAEGRIEFTQRGKVVDPSKAKGPVRLRLRD